MAHAHTDKHDGHGHEPHPTSYYVKIYFILLGLLIVSIIGPELGIRSLTLITAFGIAVVKALIVAAYFMHLNVEKRYIWYIMYTMLLMVALFFVATAPDIMHRHGSNWINYSADAVIEEHHKAKAEAGEHAAPH